MLRAIHTTSSPHMIESTGEGCRRNDCPSELATWVPGKKYQQRSPLGWLWIIPTVPVHPACSQVCLGTTCVAVDCGGSTSAGATRCTITVDPRTSPIMHPMNSVGNERYWSAR